MFTRPCTRHANAMLLEPTWNHCRACTVDCEQQRISLSSSAK